MGKAMKKPTINIAMLIHLVKQIENLTGHSVDDLIDMLFRGNLSDDLKTLIMDTLDRIKNDPVDVGVNSALYALIYKLAKKQFGPMVGRIDLGLFYLKPI